MQGFSQETIGAFIKWSLESAGADHGAHITRFKMYNDLQDSLSSYDGPSKTALAISHSESFGRDVLGVKAAKYTEVNYPESNMLDLQFAKDEFDFCFSDQVLEHVEGDPYDAFSESVRVIKPGGYICHTTCFINGVHGFPKDFWRFTPAALSLMAQKANCEVIVSDGWGNREAWALIDAGFRFQPIPRNPKHPLHDIATRNDPQWPIVVWIVARKSEGHNETITKNSSKTRDDLLDAKARIRDFENSTSWKMTAPIRRMKKFFMRGSH